MVPLVGSVIRLRIFSSVDLPAPLRPIRADDLPPRHLERDVLQGPEVRSSAGSVVLPAADSRSARAE